MSSGSGPLAGYVVLLMLSTIVVYGFPLQHVPPGNKLAQTNPSFTHTKKTMTRPKYVPFGGRKELNFLRNAIVSLEGGNGVLFDNSGNSKSQHILHETGSSLDETDSSIVQIHSDKTDSSDSSIRVRKRCVHCGRGRATTERPVFMFDPLRKKEVPPDIADLEAIPPTNNSLIILPLMAIIVFIGTVCAKCCRWTQKDVREVGFIVEAKPLKKNTISRGIMQMHNFGLASRSKRSKRGKNVGMKTPEQFMFLPLLLGQQINVRSNGAAYGRSRTPPRTTIKSAGLGRQFQSLTEVFDPGFDAGEDTDEERPASGQGRKRQSSSQPRELGSRISVSPLGRGSKGSSRSSSKRSRSTTLGSYDCPDNELDSSEEERLELEEQCRRGLAVLAHINPVPLAKKPKRLSTDSRSASSSTKALYGQKVSVRAEVHETHDLKLPQEPHGSRHSSADASVDTHDLIEHIEDYYGVDIRAFINLWHHRRRFANITDAVDLQTAAAYARRNEIKRSQSYKKPKKTKPCIKRQVSFPCDLPQSFDADEVLDQDEIPPNLSRSVSTVDDEVFKLTEEVLLSTPVRNRRSHDENRVTEIVELHNLSPPKDPELAMLDQLRNLPISPTSSHHSICDDSGYHNHSFSKLVTSQTGPPLQRTSSDDSAVATNIASESSQSNPDGSPRDKLNSLFHSKGGGVVSLSLSDLTTQDRLNCQNSHDSCASDSMQRTPSLQFNVDCIASSQPNGATCLADEHAHENGVFSKSGHKPKLKELSNHVNMSTVGSNDMSDDTEKLLDPADGYIRVANFDDQDKSSRRNSGLFNSGKEIPVAFPINNHEDGVIGALGHDGVKEDDLSDHEESFDSSPNAPLLQNSILKSRGSREKSTDRENNNEHMV